MKRPKHLSSIIALRRKYPKNMLGYRERSILFAKGARITKARDYADCFRVSSGSRFFVFTYGKTGYKDYTVVN